MPDFYSGGGYHVIVVKAVDDAAGVARVGDLADEWIDLPLADLAQAWARIRKQKHRLVGVTRGDAPIDLRSAVIDGMRACVAGLTTEKRSNFSLAGIKTWTECLHGNETKDSWSQIFKPGPNLWRGLTSISDFIEHYGTGGGLMLPMFSEFLAGAASALSMPELEPAAVRYAALGAEWTELAESWPTRRCLKTSQSSDARAS